MSTATLLVIHGPNQGTRYSVEPEQTETTIGRSVGCDIRLDDHEVSRRHVMVCYDGVSFQIQDLNSANGTRLNSRFIETSPLTHGDTIRIGASLISFQLSDPLVAARDSAQQVLLIDDTADQQHSAIVKSVAVPPASAMTVHHVPIQDSRLMYRVAEELVRPTHSQQTLLNEILKLVLSAVGADRGCFLLRKSDGTLNPAAYQQRLDQEEASPQIQVSHSITGYVINNGQAVRTSDATKDTRFGGLSIAADGVHEVICAPLRGHEELLGVLYIDTKNHDVVPGFATASRLTDDHLTAVLAVARQSALAVEARQFHDAFLQAERFATMGRTVAVLSHHIRNILQGIKGGGYLIAKGLEDDQKEMAIEGWSVVERNQNRIFELVTDMLSFSRDRIPQLQVANLNAVCAEVSELASLRAGESETEFMFKPDTDIPPAAFDPEAIHRAVLNTVNNAIDAVYQREQAAVILQTGYDADQDMMLVAVSDNGPGIPEDQRETVFNIFESSKGYGGTGIGLPVSLKIVREHGGQIRIDSESGSGTRFVLSWPRGRPDELKSPVK
ncbi:MAG: ATP-binding protein [Fuerstiella sp.]|nr:ATP-binding protein [Fuerstiella sp.]